MPQVFSVGQCMNWLRWQFCLQMSKIMLTLVFFLIHVVWNSLGVCLLSETTYIWHSTLRFQFTRFVRVAGHSHINPDTYTLYDVLGDLWVVFLFLLCPTATVAGTRTEKYSFNVLPHGWATGEIQTAEQWWLDDERLTLINKKVTEGNSWILWWQTTRKRWWQWTQGLEMGFKKEWDITKAIKAIEAIWTNSLMKNGEENQGLFVAGVPGVGGTRVLRWVGRKESGGGT